MPEDVVKSARAEQRAEAATIASATYFWALSFCQPSGMVGRGSVPDLSFVVAAQLSGQGGSDTGYRANVERLESSMGTCYRSDQLVNPAGSVSY